MCLIEECGDFSNIDGKTWYREFNASSPLQTLFDNDMLFCASLASSKKAGVGLTIVLTMRCLVKIWSSYAQCAASFRDRTKTMIARETWQDFVCFLRPAIGQLLGEKGKRGEIFRNCRFLSLVMVECVPPSSVPQWETKSNSLRSLPCFITPVLGMSFGREQTRIRTVLVFTETDPRWGQVCAGFARATGSECDFPDSQSFSLKFEQWSLCG